MEKELNLPETPITKIPAPRRVWRPRFSVPIVNRVGYIGASRKKMAIKTPTAALPFAAQMTALSAMAMAA
jgi:hypothetical protein